MASISMNSSILEAPQRGLLLHCNAEGTGKRIGKIRDTGLAFLITKCGAIAKGRTYCHAATDIESDLYDYCLTEKIADAQLIAKWKKSGYENLCCLRCIQARDTNFGTNCVCRVVKTKMEEGRIIECVHCGCRGCSGKDTRNHYRLSISTLDDHPLIDCFCRIDQSINRYDFLNEEGHTFCFV